MSRADADDLLESLTVAVRPPRMREPKTATVQAIVGARCTLLFDGETVTGAKAYPRASSYQPTVGDRVVVLPVGSATSWLIVGAIDSGAAAPALTLTNTTASGTQSIVKRTGLVVVNFRLTTTAAIAQYGTIATLPVGYRPDPAGNDLFFGGAIQGGGGWVAMTFFVEASTGNIKPLTAGIANALIASAAIPAFPAGA